MIVATEHVVTSVPPMAKPDLASLPRWAGWSGAGRLRLRLAKVYRCYDCRIDVLAIAENYRVHDHVRAQARICDRGILCIGCLEARIGRRLTARDFTKAPINRSACWVLPGHEDVPIRRSARFVDRLWRR